MAHFQTDLFLPELTDAAIAAITTATSDELVRMACGPNYARLVEIKKKYDPRNVLRLNQNIKPD